MKATGAVIVTHNSEAEIGACLDSVLGRVSQVVVVDNASSDGTRDQVLEPPDAGLIANRGGRSVGKLHRESREVYWCASLLSYGSRHFRTSGRLAICAAVVAGCSLRMLYGVFREWNLRPLAVYPRVITFACLRLVTGRDGEAGVLPARARQ